MYLRGGACARRIGKDVTPMEPDYEALASLFPNIAAQLRSGLSNFYLAAAHLAPPEMREMDPELDAQAAILDQSYYRLLRMVGSLTAATYLMDSAPLPMRDGDLVDLVRELCGELEGLAPFLGVRLQVKCDMPHHICAMNEEALGQVLYHLVSNAFKHTPPGGVITVELTVQDQQIHLSVSDTGRGIPEEKLASLFERRIRPGAVEPLSCGLGLGLPFCRRVAEDHQGSLLAVSRPGEGSRFLLFFPDRQIGGGVSDMPFDYSGGFNRALLALADVLPAEAFLIRNRG